ncbi:RcnB family protein [Sphingobium sp. WCS2017Hpa-17]|uniref:RcnB family protein n=1 Tax=Sphingobium sp. WCS2017Hpa-17 TaxID=3073638 RepID=UPI002889C834|nr:RcnB family protein [Sphingobium sp. WCS2017Hpa-17]
MKKAVLFLSIALIVTPDIALAQQHQQHDRPVAPKPTIRPAPARPNPPQSHNPRPQPPKPTPPRPTPPRPGTGGPAIQPPRPGTGGPAIQPPRPGRPQPPKPQPPRPVKPLPPHRPGAGRPPHFKPIHRPGFQYPHGYRYRRWTIGLLLPSLFLSSRYYYDDYSYLGVGAPPVGYRWVRYGPDLLLVRIRTRRVVDVIYGAFY